MNNVFIPLEKNQKKVGKKNLSVTVSVTERTCQIKSKFGFSFRTPHMHCIASKFCSHTFSDPEPMDCNRLHAGVTSQVKFIPQLKHHWADRLVCCVCVCVFVHVCVCVYVCVCFLAPRIGSLHGKM